MLVTLWSPLTLVVFILSLATHAQDNRAPDPNNHFIYPPLPGNQSSNDPYVFATDLNFTVGATLDIPFKWTTNMSNYSLVLIQEAPPTEFQTVTLLDCGDDDAEFLYWDGDIGTIDLTVSFYAYLGVYNCTDPDEHTTPIFFSHYINLTEPVDTAVSTTTSASPSATATSRPTVSTAAAATTSSSSNNGGSNNTVALGAGIGGGIGGAILLVGIGAFIIYWRRSKRAQLGSPYGSDGRSQTPFLGNNNASDKYSQADMQKGSGVYEQRSTMYSDQQYPMHEMSAAQPGTHQVPYREPAELSNSSVRG